ncbi:MAG: hypothetical protein PWP51_77 [Clostridiales bacterium]|jgi:hypothetical protein|nr:hypothetical protein [Clostridiales bacterium]MDN5297524.1 hypothetical protein [Clostridiales bacterium]
MKHINWDKLSYTTLGIVIGVALSFGISGADNTAGTSSDPLVTLSYLNQQMSALEARMTGDVNEKISALDVSTPSLFEVINVPNGTTLYFGASTEFILRVGTAVVVDPNAVGIPDLTSGIKVDDKGIVPLDHHMLVPSDDGRGIKLTSDCWLMVKGTYTTADQ